VVHLPEALERSPNSFGFLDSLLVSERFAGVLVLVSTQICDIVPLVRHWWWGHGSDESHCY